MQDTVIISGFGGQGIILAGKLLAQAAMAGSMEVTFMPAYGAEVRGGASNCTVVISDQPIPCPLVSYPDCLIAMSKMAVSRFSRQVKPGGVLLYDSNLIDEQPAVCDGVTVVAIPAETIATKAGNIKSANMVMVGGYLCARPLLTVDQVINSLSCVLGQKGHETIAINAQAIRQGHQFVQQLLITNASPQTTATDSPPQQYCGRYPAGLQ